MEEGAHVNHRRLALLGKSWNFTKECKFSQNPTCQTVLYFNSRSEFECQYLPGWLGYGQRCDKMPPGGLADKWRPLCFQTWVCDWLIPGGAMTWVWHGPHTPRTLSGPVQQCWLAGCKAREGTCQKFLDKGCLCKRPFTRQGTPQQNCRNNWHIRNLCLVWAMRIVSELSFGKSDILWGNIW